MILFVALGDVFAVVEAVGISKSGAAISGANGSASRSNANTMLETKHVASCCLFFMITIVFVGDGQ